ncbi:hypothetical protein MBLNU13_g10648t1 [Cladosporium sp. NU13]
MTPTPKEAKKHSPTLTRLLKARPAPSRETTLLEAAFSETKPVKPPPGECCGSSCDPCVMDLYAQELKVWKECAAYRESLGGDGEGSGSGSGSGEAGRMRELECFLNLEDVLDWSTTWKTGSRLAAMLNSDQNDGHQRR